MIGENAMYFEKYNRKLPCKKSLSMKTLSNTLIFHLKRFTAEFDDTNQYGLNQLKKLNDKFTFPQTLDMSPWALKEHKDKDGKVVKRAESYYKYELVGVLVHSGSATSGHYISYIKQRDNDNWLEFNDHTVRHFNPNNIPEVAYGGYQVATSWDPVTRQNVKKQKLRERNAYMLFYDRVVKTEPDPTDIKYDSSGIDVSQPPFVDALLLDDIKKWEEEKCMGADNIKRINDAPFPVVERIWRENAEFLRDRQFFSGQYFDFFLHFLQCLEPEVNEEYPQNIEALMQEEIDCVHVGSVGLVTLKMATRLWIETMSNAQENEFLGSWVPVLIRLYSKNVPAMVWFAEYIQRYGLLKLMLLNCPHERVRIHFQTFVSGILRALSPYEDEFILEESEIRMHTAAGTIQPTRRYNAATCRVIMAVWSLLDASRPFWQSFKQYFRVIGEFAKIGWKQRKFLVIKVHLIKTYIDWFMNRPGSRAAVMDDMNLPDLREFIDTMALCYRNLKTESWKEGGVLPPTSLVTEKDELIELSKHQIERIFDKTFFNSMIEMDYNTKGAAMIVCHSSWECKERSKWFVSIILSFFRKFQLHMLPGLMYVTRHVLAIEDSLQDQRIFWLMCPFDTAPPINTYHHHSVRNKGLLAIVQGETHKGDAVYKIALFIVQLMSESQKMRDFMQGQISDFFFLRDYFEAKIESGDVFEEKGLPTAKEALKLVTEMLSGLSTDSALIAELHKSKVKIKDLEQKIKAMERDYAELEGKYDKLKFSMPNEVNRHNQQYDPTSGYNTEPDWRTTAANDDPGPDWRNHGAPNDDPTDEQVNERVAEIDAQSDTSTEMKDTSYPDNPTVTIGPNASDDETYPKDVPTSTADYNINNADNDPHFDHDDMTDHHSTDMTSMISGNAMLQDNTDELVSQLQAILPQYDAPFLKMALQDNNNSVEATASRLFEDGYVTALKARASSSLD